ncbi:MAG: AAA family ATPase, partial [Clostridia bacterium]|nr:AAA family ATPase [Clostridia bacterium]
SNNIHGMLEYIKKIVLWDFDEIYPDVRYFDRNILAFCFEDVYRYSKKPFVFLIDEWDCIFREYRNDKESQNKYLDFLRDLLKDKDYIALVYMTGILPIKKYGTHSALNMFTEYSMTNSGKIANSVGFTEEEVQKLCEKFNMNIDTMRYWYNGYHLGKYNLYCSRSVSTAISNEEYDSYWTQTETYEALENYITMNLYGLNDAVKRLVAGEKIEIDPLGFTNDMVTLTNRDDVLTLLVHLGYLGYIFQTKEVYIPNKEVRDVYVTSMNKSGQWKETVKFIKMSKELTKLTESKNSEKVAEVIEQVHRTEIAPIHYNNEQSLRYVVLLSYFYSRERYNIIQEMPSGDGYADIMLVPNFQNPDGIPIIIELKCNESPDAAINQIKNKHYYDTIKNYNKVLLVGISYDKKTKKHKCVIEEYAIN